jgi:hypothetical protein
MKKVLDSESSYLTGVCAEMERGQAVAVGRMLSAR